MVRKLPNEWDPKIDEYVQKIYNYKEFEQGTLYNCNGEEYIRDNLTIDFIGAFWRKVE